MRMKRTLWIVAGVWIFPVLQAHAAEIAVMPVQGVNLSAGECDAIGVLFANALARDARVAVASPLQAKSLRAEGKVASAVAAQLGTAKYVELSALRLGKRVRLGGAIFDRDGTRIFQAETTAPDLDAVGTSVRLLAHALAYEQPIRAGMTYGVSPDGGEEPTGVAAPAEVPEPAPTPPDPNVARSSNGVKAGIVTMFASGKTFSPGVSFQFDSRFGPSSYFLELGAGILLPVDDQSSVTSIRVTSGFLELGANAYLWAGNSALYAGAGLMPAIWMSRLGIDDHTSATCSAHAQVGLTFNRTQRFKIYAEARLYQLLIAVSDPLSDGLVHTDLLSESYRPMVLAFQFGVGW
jgi:hypothetical protein